MAPAGEKETEDIFLQQARSLMLDSMKLAAIRVRRALTQEEKLDLLLDMIGSEETLTQKEKTSLLNTIKDLQLLSVRELSSIVSMLYDRASGKESGGDDAVIRVELTE